MTMQIQIRNADQSRRLVVHTEDVSAAGALVDTSSTPLLPGAHAPFYIHDRRHLRLVEGTQITDAERAELADATPVDPRSPGQIAFEAYNESKGGLTYDGKPIPPWSSLTDEAGTAVRVGWESAATAVLAR